MTTATDDEMPFEKRIWEASVMKETTSFHTAQIIYLWWSLIKAV